MFLGIDVSTYLEQQKFAHTIYKKDGKPVDPFELFKNNGVDYLRTRIWNNPYSEDGKPYLAGTCDLDNFLNLYKRVKQYGFKHVIDFHYSDFWVDPSKQILPKAWRNYSFEEVVQAVYDFTKESLLKIKNAGVDVAYIQTGNEITHGMLWPHGKINYGEVNPYRNFAVLLKSARKACKEIYPEAKIIIHLEESYNQVLYRDIISSLLKNGLEIDMIGTSYYPFWHHSFAEYFANMDMVQREFNIPVCNVELGYPFTLEDYIKPVFLEGTGDATITEYNSPNNKFHIEITSENALVQFPQFYYANYTMYSGKKNLGKAKNVDGLIAFELPEGTYDVKLSFKPSKGYQLTRPLFYLGLFSLVSVGVFGYIYRKNWLKEE